MKDATVKTRAKTLTAGVALCALAACVIFSPRGRAQSDKPSDLAQKLSERVPECRVEGTFVEALGQTARAFSIPMGISWVRTESSEKKRVIEYKDATVLEIIQKIAATEPGYTVQATDKIVHVTTDEIPARENFLYLKILGFSGTGVAAVVKASLWILLNREIAPSPHQTYNASIAHRASDPKLNLQFTNATVEEILDSIAAESDDKVWAVTFDDSANPMPSGFRRTEAYASKAPAPDQEQPVWDIFRWDYWPVQLVSQPATTQ